MKRYMRYKDSGVNWIGEIPEHWGKLNLSQTAKEYYVSNKSILHQNLLSLSYGRIVRKNINITKGLLPASFDSYQVVKEGIIILRLTDLQNDQKSLRVGYAFEEGIVTSAYLSLMPRANTYPKYLYYELHTNDIHKIFYSMGNGIRQSLNYDGIRYLPIILPPLPEQRHIVTYLDAKVTLIDRYISKREEEIARLKEWKQALISKAVTKGLDPNAKMKDSGIAWIGEVPEKWGIRKLSQAASEYFVSNQNIHHKNLLSLSYGRIVRKDINANKGLLPSSFDTYQVVTKGIIVMRLTDLQNDHTSLRVGLAKEEGIVTSAYLSLKPREDVLPEYLYYQLHVNDVHKIFYGMGEGLRQNLNYSGIRTLPVLIPPLPDQHTIVRYIEEKTTKADKLISKLSLQVDYLKEYKQRLISDVVTGKINVQPE